MHRYSWTKRSSFVKVENNLYRSPAGVKLKAPRMIQGAQPEFITLVGPWIAALQGLIKRRWGKDNFLTFTSGIDAKDLAAGIDRPGWQLLEDDLGKFDCSIRRPWCEYEVWLAKKFGAPRAVLDLMKANISTHGSTHHGWRYKVDGTRKSGDPYTSLFNSIINGGAHLFLYCKATGKTVHQAKLTLKMLLQGDDNALAHRDTMKIPFQSGMAELGFDSKASYKTLDTLEFCSNRVYATDQGYVFGPKPGKVLAKFGVIINPPAGASQNELMRGIALGLKKQTAFIAPLKTVVDHVIRLTKGSEAKYVSRWMRDQEYTIKTLGDYKSTEETTYQLELQYGWTVEMQEEWERYIGSLKFGDDFDHPFAKLLFDRDTLGLNAYFRPQRK
jgi:hypothetical protein